MPADTKSKAGYASLPRDEKNDGKGAVAQDEAAARREKSEWHRQLRIIGFIYLCVLLLLGYIVKDFILPNRNQCMADRGSKVAKPALELKTIEGRVAEILSNTPLIDGHNDLPILIRELHQNHIYDDDFKLPFEQGGLSRHVDLPRLRAGLNGGAFWSVYWQCPSNGTDFSDEAYLPAVAATLQQIDLVNRLKAAYPTDFAPNDVGSAGAIAAFRKGQLISPLGVEGLHQIGNSAATLRLFYNLGVRYVTLTHNCGNRFADAALAEGPTRVAEPYWGGVSPEGEKMILEMNRIGMIVDLAHTSANTMRDVLGGSGKAPITKAPIIYSHSSAYAVCPHPRNVPDDVLQLVKATNSLVMVNFAPDFVSCTAAPEDSKTGLPEFYPANATLEHVVNHIMHIGEVAGFDHVGLGSDFDGISSTPKGLEDVSKYPDLVAEMLRRGVSDEDAAKVVGGNLLRVWKEVEDVAAGLQAAGQPLLEDDLGKLHGFESLGIYRDL